MKEEWKPDALRETAEEIRSAVMPKSITPDMVGGTLLALTNAVGEVVETLGEIPREHVKVKVRGYDGTGAVSAAGATVRLDMFAVGGFPTHAVPRQELTADEDGVVEFDVPWGYKYAVSSHIEGLGASFQLVFDAVVKNRMVNLWNFPVGVWALGRAYYVLDADEDTGREHVHRRTAPFITDSFSDDVRVDYGMDIPSWDANVGDGEYVDEWYYIGILVSTVDTTFAIESNSLADQGIEWNDSVRDNNLIPLLDYAVEKCLYDIDIHAAKEKARQDMDGNMNTAKILAADPTHTAARCASIDFVWYEGVQHFLPSAGQLYIMWLNRIAINNIVHQLIDFGRGYHLLPYQDEKGRWQYPNKTSEGGVIFEDWWSSSVLSPNHIWVVSADGQIFDDFVDYGHCVRAMSVFHFE